MTAVWILMFVCTSSLPTCSQGDVSVANQSYTSSEECYADGAVHSKSDMTPCRRVRNDQLGYAKATWRPATKAIWSVVNLRFGRSLR